MQHFYCNNCRKIQSGLLSVRNTLPEMKQIQVQHNPLKDRLAKVADKVLTCQHFLTITRTGASVQHMISLCATWCNFDPCICAF